MGVSMTKLDSHWASTYSLVHLLFLGYNGTRCEFNINECTTVSCNNGQCVDELGDYTCLCHPGYTGQYCDVEINECASNPCRYSGACEDLVNAFNCTCPQGTMGMNDG